MRRVRYAVAMSLDGFIAGPQGEADWIEMDSSVDIAAYFTTFYAQFDTAVMGRQSYDVFGGAVEGMDTYVFSRTLPPGPRAFTRKLLSTTGRSARPPGRPTSRRISRKRPRYALPRTRLSIVVTRNARSVRRRYSHASISG